MGASSRKAVITARSSIGLPKTTAGGSRGLQAPDVPAMNTTGIAPFRTMIVPTACWP